MNKTCAICNKNFESKSSVAKYCSPECQKIAKNKQMKAIVKKQYYSKKLFGTKQFREIAAKFYENPEAMEKLSLDSIKILRESNRGIIPEEYINDLERKTLNLIQSLKEACKEVDTLKQKLRKNGVTI